MLHTSFTHNYKVTMNPELPGNGQWGIPEIYVPSKFSPKPNSGIHLLLEFEIDQVKQVWHVNEPENIEVWTTPDPEKILIVGQNAAYYVSVRNPSDNLKIDLYSTQVTPIKEQGVLLINDYFSMMAFDSSGIRWRTQPLVDDDLTVERIDGNMIVCSGYSFDDINAKVRLTLDIKTGVVLENVISPTKRKTVKQSLARLFKRT